MVHGDINFGKNTLCWSYRRHRIYRPRIVLVPFPVAPSLDLSALKDLKIKAGRPINFTIPIKGEPTPKATWTINGQPVTARVDCAATSTVCTLDIPVSVREDSGRYTLELKNEYGTASGTAQVTVMGERTLALYHDPNLQV